jgi:hypothetical protein
MYTINNIAEATLVHARGQSTSPTVHNGVDMLGIDFALFLYLLDKLIGARFWVLFLAISERVYLL